MEIPTHDPDRLAAAAKELGLELVVLFGSYATGSPPPGPESDIDVALLANPRAPAPSLFDAYRAFDGVFEAANVDLVVLKGVDPLFRHEVMSRGVRLYGDVERFLNYRAFAFRDYTDSASLRAVERVLVERKLARVEKVLDAAS